MTSEDFSQQLKELEQDVYEESVNVRFFESDAFPAFEKLLEQDIRKFQDVLYNQGKPTEGEFDHLRVNGARTEISVRLTFLERFRNSVPKYKQALEALEAFQKENPQGGLK